MSNSGPEERACVTWNQVTTAVIIGYSVCSVVSITVAVLVSVSISSRPTIPPTINNAATVNIESDAEKSALIEKLARENIRDATLHGPTSGL